MYRYVGPKVAACPVYTQNKDSSSSTGGNQEMENGYTEYCYAPATSSQVNKYNFVPSSFDSAKVIVSSSTLPYHTTLVL